MPRPFTPKLLALLVAAALAGCGGGSSSDTTPSGNPPPSGNPSPGNPPPTGNPPPGENPPATGAPAEVPANTTMTMACVDGAATLCSGDTVIRVENGVALTSSGVQVIGRSTSDAATPVTDVTTASGLALMSGGPGLAEVRLAKDASGSVTSQALLLSNLGISWDGRNERPQVIETFNPTQGRVIRNDNGTLTFASLPDSSNLGYYDFATLGTRGTQLHYANNRYFPRAGNPSRCGAGVTNCAANETTGVSSVSGDWRSNGDIPDFATASRLHSDGDVHAGNGQPDANGNPTILAGGSGIGVPYPGSKGYRYFANYGFQHVNLAAWMSQDTIDIAEWTGGNGRVERNQNRRGLVAFGNVTPPGNVPTSGTATYSGIAYGWYSGNGAGDPSFFQGAASVTVNFVTREVTVTVANTATQDQAGTAVPAGFTSSARMGATGAQVANYFTGRVNGDSLSGGVGGRYFGPIVTRGDSGAGPDEVGGTFSLSGQASGSTIVGGFIARKR